MQTPFTLQERQDLLGRYFPIYRQWQDLDYRICVAAGPVPDDLSRERDDLDRTLMDLREKYQAGLPFLPITRCPFSGQVVYHSLDPYGIDGLWWNYEAPVRPVENLPVTFHAITGAIRLDGSFGNAPFLCVPGPAVPYVVPKILENDHLRAVVSSLPIGNNTAYIVAYFTDQEDVRVPRVDCLGMNRWEIVDRNGTFQWGEGLLAAGDYDFDLAGWVERGRLLWIPPDDRTLTLQKGTYGCPYLSLPETRRVQRIWQGVVRKDGED